MSYTNGLATILIVIYYTHTILTVYSNHGNNKKNLIRHQEY
jgi:uncharacterized membrane protein